MAVLSILEWVARLHTFNISIMILLESTQSIVHLNTAFTRTPVHRLLLYAPHSTTVTTTKEAWCQHITKCSCLPEETLTSRARITSSDKVAAAIILSCYSYFPQSSAYHENNNHFSGSLPGGFPELPVPPPPNHRTQTSTNKQTKSLIPSSEFSSFQHSLFRAEHSTVCADCHGGVGRWPRQMWDDERKWRKHSTFEIGQSLFEMKWTCGPNDVASLWIDTTTPNRECPYLWWF